VQLVRASSSGRGPRAMAASSLRSTTSSSCIDDIHMQYVDTRGR
jgi:hypothetical protein